MRFRMIPVVASALALVLTSACVKLGGNEAQDGDPGVGAGVGIGGGGAAAAPGPDRLDSSVGGGTGMTVIAPTVAKDVAVALAAQSDKRSVVLGHCHVSTTTADPKAIDFDLCAVRYGTDGNQDKTFGGGTGGYFSTRLSTGEDLAAGIVARPDDSLFAAATRNAKADADMAVVRLTKTGTLDTTWGTNGSYVVQYPSNRASHAEGIVVDGSGRAIVVGYTFADSTVSSAAIARVRLDGRALDTTYGIGGNPQYQVGSGALRVNFATGLGQAFSAATLDGQGRVVAVGYVQRDTNRDVLVARFTQGGVLDTSFAGQGFVIVNSSGTDDDDAQAVRIDAKNRIVVAGTSRTGNESNFLALRILDTGAMDPSFGAQGWIRWDVVSDDTLADAVVGEDNRIYLLGSGTYEGVERPTFLRIGPDGQMERKVIPFPSWSRSASFAQGALLDTSTLVAAGTFYSASSQFDLFFARFIR